MTDEVLIEPRVTVPKFKVLFACNTLTQVQQGPYTDHMRLAYRLGADYPDIQFIQFFAKRTSIDRFRNMAARLAVDHGCRYLWFIDDDMQMPYDTFTKLYEGMVNQGYDILSAFTYIRGYPFKIMSFKWDLMAGHRRLRNLVESDLPEVPGAIVPCDAIGTAIAMIKTDLFHRMPAPWFLTGPHGTEDIYMCLKAKDYYQPTKIGMHSGAIIGHVLDPEVISYRTRGALMKYYESFMDPADVRAAQSDDYRVAHLPDVGKRELRYEDLMGAEFGNKVV